jgi:hypothetical protein
MRKKKLVLKDEIKNHQNLNKKTGKKLKIKRRRTKLKNITHDKLELRTRLKIKKLSQNDQGKEIKIQPIRTE